MPSRTETLGLVILEAMSSGVPVVAARAGGIPELIEDGVTGYLFDEETEAIAAIQNLLRSQETRSAIGIAGRQWASEHSWAAATQELIKCYQAACEGQNVSDDPAQEHPSLRFRARRAARRTTLFAIRKLLP
jgi:glycosyltransferase involved in cell wall biosynthesis